MDSFVGFFVCLNVWSSISGFSKGIQLCVDYNSIRVQSQGNTAEKHTFAKNLVSSEILPSMASLANFCELDSNRVFSREEKAALPDLGPGETAGASLDLQTAKACLFVHLSGIRSPACCFWVGRCVIS